jgi:uncharacterized membrane protein YjgN (DUF898 family)
LQVIQIFTNQLHVSWMKIWNKDNLRLCYPYIYGPFVISLQSFVFPLCYRSDIWFWNTQAFWKRFRPWLILKHMSWISQVLILEALDSGLFKPLARLWSLRYWSFRNFVPTDQEHLFFVICYFVVGKIIGI